MNLKLKELRLLAGKTQNQVASAMGLTQTGYNGYEQGRRMPNIEMVVKLAEYFDVTVDELLGKKVDSNLKIKKLSQTQRDLINQIKGLNDNQCERVKGYIDGITVHHEDEME
jgi:transcriptional regulator with XRE-family HTH domain